MDSPRSGFRRVAVASWALAGIGVAGVAGASALAYAETLKPAPVAADVQESGGAVIATPSPPVVGPPVSVDAALPAPIVAAPQPVQQRPVMTDPPSYAPAPTYTPTQTYVPEQTYAPAPAYIPPPAYVPAPTVAPQGAIGATAPRSGASSSSGTSSTRQNRVPVGGGSAPNKFTPPHTVSKGS